MLSVFILLGLCIIGIVDLELSFIGEPRNRACAIIKGMVSFILYCCTFFIYLFTMYYICKYCYDSTTSAREVAFFVGFGFIVLFLNYGRSLLTDNTSIRIDWFMLCLQVILSIGAIRVWNIWIFNYVDPSV